MIEPKSVPAGFHLQKRHDAVTGKTIVTIHHSTGLTVKLLPFPGFARKFAAAAIPFGSVHTAFRQNGRLVAVPAGTAHFLEHCIFSRDEDGGLAGRLAELGASANAYTTYDHTLYYFSTVNHVEAAFTQWLDAVFRPSLDEARVTAERPIFWLNWISTGMTRTAAACSRSWKTCTAAIRSARISAGLLSLSRRSG